MGIGITVCPVYPVYPVCSVCLNHAAWRQAKGEISLLGLYRLLRRDGLTKKTFYDTKFGQEVRLHENE